MLKKFAAPAFAMLILVSTIVVGSTTSYSMEQEDMVIDQDRWVNQSFSLSKNLIITETGRLFIQNSTFGLDQSGPKEFGVEISGKLVMRNSSFSSHHSYDITLKNDGELVLLNSTMTSIGIFTANDGNGNIKLKESELTIAEPTPLNVDEFEMESSSMDLWGTMNANRVAIRKISNVTSENLVFAINTCDELVLEDSHLSSVTCSLNYVNVEMTDVKMDTLVIDNGKSVALNGCNISTVDFGILKKLVISDSIIGGGLSLDSVQELSMAGTHYGDALNCPIYVEMSNTILHELTLKNGGLLNNVTANDIMISSTSTTETEIWGWKHVTSLENGTNVPGINVTGNAKVFLYRWVTVEVVDNSGDPLSGATVEVREELTDVLLASGKTGPDGRVHLSVKTMTIEEGEQDFYGYVQVGSEYNGKKADERSLALTEDVTLMSSIDDVNKPSEENDFFIPTWLIILVAAILMLALLAGGGYYYYLYYY